MKISIIPFILFLALIFTLEAPNEIFINETEYSLEINCENGETCSCIAAGGCSYVQGSSCRIEYCSGNVESESTNSKPANITVIQQPCPKIE